MTRIGHSAIKILGKEGKRVMIIPTTKGMNITEVYVNNKGLIGEFLCYILYDKKWKKYVMCYLSEKSRVGYVYRYKSK